MVTAITAWIEHEIAPDKIMAIKYSSDSEQQQLGPPTSSEVTNNKGNLSIAILQTNATMTDEVSSKSGNQSAGQILPTAAIQIACQER